jgi:hypothetical protein
MSELIAKRSWRGLTLAVALLLGVGGAHATPLDNGGIGAAAVRARDEPIDTLVQSVEHAHPIAMFLLAKRLYDLDRRDEAAFWFYTGQLRWRSCLSGNPSCGGRESFSRLFETIGPDLNQHAFRSIPALSSMIESVLAWDESHHDDYTIDPSAKERTRQGLRELMERTQANAAQLEARNAQLAREAQARGNDPFAGSGGVFMGMPQELLTAYDAERFAAFSRNVTTRDEVIAALGRPEWWTTDANGESTFGYSFMRTTDVSSALGMAERVQVTIEFNASKVFTGVGLPRS